MYETTEELARLQDLLDSSQRTAGPHLRSIVTQDRRLNALQVCDEMKGMRLIQVATVTADSRPLVGTVDGYFLHGSFYFSSARDSVRMNHLSRRRAVSATYAPSERIAITVHGEASLFDVLDPGHPDLHRAMLDHYLPKQGDGFEIWLKAVSPVGARIEAEKMFTFKMTG